MTGNASGNNRNANIEDKSIHKYTFDPFFAHCSKNNQHVILVKTKERKGSCDE